MTVPIDRLPPELLSQAFEEGLPPYEDFDATTVDRRQEFLSSICLVSVFWKNVAYDSPHLWSLIRVHYDEKPPGGSEPDYGSRRGQLERAKNVELDIILQRRCFNNQVAQRPALWEFWELLKENRAQWRSLRVDRIPIDSVAEFMRTFPTSLPNLVDFQSSLYHTVATPAGVISTPRLRRFRCIAYFFPISHTHALEYVRISGAYQIPHHLEHCTALRTLHLEVLMEPNLHGSVNPIVLYPLNHLIISGISHIDQVTRIFDQLTAPNLQILSLKNMVPEPSVLSRQRDRPPIFFPALTTVECQIGSLRQFACLQGIIGRLGNTPPLILRLSSPETFLDARFEIRRFLPNELVFTQLEENVREIVWRSETSDEDCLSMWRELRRRVTVKCEPWDLISIRQSSH